MTLQLTVNDTDSIYTELRKIVVDVLEETLKNPDNFLKLSAVALDELQKNNPLTESKEQFLTRAEVSKLLKVSLVTLHNWQKSGELVPKKIGKRVLYSRVEVESKLIRQI